MKCENDLKRNILTFDNPEGFVRFSSRREIYEDFVSSSTALHRFVMETVRPFAVS